MKLQHFLVIIGVHLALAVAQAQIAQPQLQPAQLPKYLNAETAKQVGATGTIDLPRTASKPFRPALALPDGSVIEESIQTTIFLGDLEIERGVYRASCEPATRSLVRVTATGKVIWAKSYFVRGKSFLQCDHGFYGFAVYSPLAEVDYRFIYLMPDKNQFSIPLSSFRAKSPFVLFDVETGLPTTHTPANIRVIDADEVHAIKRKIIQKWLKHYKIPEETSTYDFSKTIPPLYKELEHEVFRKSANSKYLSTK